MKTNQAYINEYYEFDMVSECLEETFRITESCMNAYNNAKRQSELKSFFEGVMDDDSVVYEADNILAKIGTAIETLIKKIADVIKSITNAIFGTSKKVQEDTETVELMIHKYPELKNEIIEGINKEWFTYKDVASYEKDIAGLYKLLSDNKIDHQTFKDKAEASANKFLSSSKYIATAGLTVAGLLKAFPKITSAASENKKALGSLSSMVSDLKKNYKKAYAEDDMNNVQAALNALGKAVGLVNEESKRQTKSVGKIGSLINKIANSKMGKKFKMDDDSKAARHAAARAKLNDEANAEDDNELKKYKKDVDHKKKMDDAKKAINDSIYPPEPEKTLAQKIADAEEDEETKVKIAQARKAKRDSLYPPEPEKTLAQRIADAEEDEETKFRISQARKAKRESLYPLADQIRDIDDEANTKAIKAQAMKRANAKYNPSYNQNGNKGNKGNKGKNKKH